ncbi:MAG: hypothetical protein JXR70_01580 [Spirochaetales bacterium]|nr:hypothetical protein [Spirochaetales bacterium]
MKQMDFRHREDKDFVSRYIIYRKDNRMYIENSFFPDTLKNPELDKFFMHIANIPETLKAIMFVFKTPNGQGEFKDIIGHDETVTVLMSTERRITNLRLDTERKTEESDPLEFHFDTGEVPMDESRRVPTPAMVWVMDRMQEEYDAWKKEQGD